MRGRYAPAGAVRSRFSAECDIIYSRIGAWRDLMTWARTILLAIAVIVALYVLAQIDEYGSLFGVVMVLLGVGFIVSVFTAVRKRSDAGKEVSATKRARIEAQKSEILAMIDSALAGSTTPDQAGPDAVQAGEVRFCRICGKRTTEPAKYCNTCGSKLHV